MSLISQDHMATMLKFARETRESIWQVSSEVTILDRTFLTTLDWDTVHWTIKTDDWTVIFRPNERLRSRKIYPWKLVLFDGDFVRFEKDFLLMKMHIS